MYMLHGGTPMGYSDDIMQNVGDSTDTFDMDAILHKEAAAGG